MGPALDAFARIMNKEPYLEPGRVRRLDEDYFRRMAAVEFAVKYDDGKDPRGLRHADLVLIGVSRTSKTPLSMYLAHRRLLVANLPLIPEVEPPEELFWISPEKIVGLMIDPELLRASGRSASTAWALTAKPTTPPWSGSSWSLITPAGSWIASAVPSLTFPTRPWKK